MLHRTVFRDPRWIVTKYPTRQNGRVVPAGTRAWYYPATRTMLFGADAEAAATRFACEAADETAYCAGYGV